MFLKKKKKEEKRLGLMDFLLESEAAFFLIAANVLCFVFTHYVLAPDELPQTFILYPGNLMQGNFWCLVTSGFIHRNLSHLFFNMLGVFIFARIVERHLGIIKTLFVYFGALALSMLFSTIIYTFVLHRNVAIIGASGAVMGLISAAVLLDPFCITYELLFPIPVMVKGWMFFYADLKGFLSEEKGGTSHLAHLCGFLSVALLMYFLSKEDKQRMRLGLIINIISFIAFVLWRKDVEQFLLSAWASIGSVSP